MGLQIKARDGVSQKKAVFPASASHKRKPSELTSHNRI